MGSGINALEFGWVHCLIQKFAFTAAAAIVIGVAIAAIPAVSATVSRLGEPVQIFHGLAHQERHTGGAVAEGGVVVKIPGQVLAFDSRLGEARRVEGG